MNLIRRDLRWKRDDSFVWDKWWLWRWFKFILWRVKWWSAQDPIWLVKWCIVDECPGYVNQTTVNIELATPVYIASNIVILQYCSNIQRVPQVTDNIFSFLNKLLSNFITNETSHSKENQTGETWDTFLQNVHVILNFHLEFWNQNSFCNHSIPVQNTFWNNIHVY